jgi:hypothetical protein
MSDMVELGWVVVALVVVVCIYRIARSAIQDRSRQIEFSLKVFGLVDGKLTIKKAPATQSSTTPPSTTPRKRAPLLAEKRPSLQ